MRIANIITKLSVGGAQETVLRTGAHLDRQEFECLVITGPDPTPEGDLRAEVEASGARVITVPSLHRSIRPHTDIAAVVSLVRLLRRERPDVVHTHSSKAGLVGRLAARLAGTPAVVHTVHGWSFDQDLRGPARRLAVRAERIAARWTTTLVVVSEQVRDDGLAAGIGRRHQYQVVRSGIDLSAFSPADRDTARATLGVDPDDEVIGTVMRLAPPKDPPTFLAAARTVLARRPHAVVVIVGDGPQRDVVEAAAASASGRLRWFGARKDVAALVPGFDVFVLSSRRESMGRVVVEAMASGVPIVATDVLGLGRAIEHRVSALLVPPGDAPAMAEAIDEVLSDPERAARLAAEAGRRVAEFDERLMAERLAAIYRAATATPAAAGSHGGG